MAGKVILVKTATCRLEPVTALNYDGVSETVTIDRPVNLDDDEPTMMVPLARCFEFDADMLEHVNALVGGALDKLNAAQQLARQRPAPRGVRHRRRPRHAADALTTWPTLSSRRRARPRPTG